MTRLPALLCCIAIALPCGAAELVSYDRDIARILRTYCSGCHNDREAESDAEAAATFSDPRLHTRSAGAPGRFERGGRGKTSRGPAGKDGEAALVVAAPRRILTAAACAQPSRLPGGGGECSS